jgi:hypothetical protein
MSRGAINTLHFGSDFVVSSFLFMSYAQEGRKLGNQGAVVFCFAPAFLDIACTGRLYTGRFFLSPLLFKLGM